MKKLAIMLLIFLPLNILAQIGIKGGINFANVTEVSAINNSSQSGFAIGLFMAPKPKGIIGFRSELIYSKQGYNFETNTNTGNVNLDYILLPQLMGSTLQNLYRFN